MNKKIKSISDKLQMLTDTRVLSLLAFGVVAILVTWSGVKVVQTNYELEKKISIARQENAINKLENQNLKLRNTYYQTSQFLELASRRQFGKASPGEKLYTVPEEVALRYVTTRTVPEEYSPEASGSSNKFQRNLNAWSKFLLR